jgi:hypothetical protein
MPSFFYSAAMAEEQDREATLRWLREPPGAGEVRVFIERGEGAEISDEARQALEKLMDELNAAEVAGYMAPTIGLAPSMNIFAASIQLDYGMCGKKKKCS